MNKRVLLLDDETETNLMIIFDVVLKLAGLHMAYLVADVASAIRDPLEGGQEDWYSEDF